MTTDQQDTGTAALDTDVLVVGAGPTGLMLAAELRLGGAEVVVVDQRPGPTTESRASTLHARTMEILDSRGLLDGLGSPPCEPRGHFGGVPLDLTLPGPYPGQWKVAQTRTEELLERRAADLGADLWRRHQLLSLTVRDGADGAPEGVEAETIGPYGPVRVRARHLVGCDGEDSTVRRLVRAPFPGQDARRELLRADVSGVSVADRRFQRLRHGLAIAATRDGVTRVMVHEFGRPVTERGGGEPDFAEVTDVWKRVTGEDISHGTPLWVNAFGDANRQLARYRHGRVLFAGDAAHRQMPSGGQSSTWASRTPSTSAGSSPRWCAAAPPRACSTPTTPSATPWAARSSPTSGRRSSCCSAARRSNRPVPCSPNSSPWTAYAGTWRG